MLKLNFVTVLIYRGTVLVKHGDAGYRVRRIASSMDAANQWRF